MGQKVNTKESKGVMQRSQALAPLVESHLIRETWKVGIIFACVKGARQ
jgi:hypothetical protein